MASEGVTPADVSAVLEILRLPLWKRPDFIFASMVGLGGLFFSILAYIEAKQAKRAATEAGKGVKLQTVTLELSEVSQKIDRLRPGVSFSEARDLLSEVSRRLRRAISPFSQEPDLKDAIQQLRNALTTAETSLKSVRPSTPSNETAAPDAVYFAIERDFATINNFTADLMGLCEKKTM